MDEGPRWLGSSWPGRQRCSCDDSSLACGWAHSLTYKDIIAAALDRLHAADQARITPGTAVQGHMVPMDQPAASLDMINRFMYNKDLADEDDIVGKQQLAGAAGVRQSLKLPTAEIPQVAIV